MLLQLAFLCALLSFTQVCKAKEPDLLICDSNYWLNISCSLDSRAISNRTENITYQLEFDLGYNNKQYCSLIEEKDSYSCVFTAKLAQWHTSFADYHEYKISLCKLKQCVLLKSAYKPARHIKPIPPYNLTVQYENGSYAFAWNNGYENHVYHSVLPFEYILRYHQVGHWTKMNPWQPEKTHTPVLRLNSEKELKINKLVYKIPEAQFEPGTEYIAEVYNRIIPSTTYNGTTSYGSNIIRWKTPQAAKSVASGITGDGPSAEEIIVPICLAVGLMLLLLLPVARMQIRKTTWLKTLNPTIQSLNQTDQGNFQFWLSKCHVQEIYNEEISTIDMITEITAKEQLQEHTSDIASQYHTPYVGPLMEVWKPCLKPGQLSHIPANNPCTDPDFLFDVCDVEETFVSLNMAKAVGFVSLDDLEPRFEICKPSEVLTITPNPECFAQSYCTLTKTAIGLIPTFCRGQCAPNLDLGLNGPTSSDLLNMQIEENTPELDTVTLDNFQLSIEDSTI